MTSGFRPRAGPAGIGARLRANILLEERKGSPRHGEAVLDPRSAKRAYHPP